MKPFKFLDTNKKIFPFEIVKNFIFSPDCMVETEVWSRQRSDVVKAWISELFYEDKLDRDHFETYLPEIDRVCCLTEYSYVSGVGFGPATFEVTVRIYKSIAANEFMEVEISYPIL